MKRKLLAIFALVLVVSMLAACGGNKEAASKQEPEAASKQEQKQEPAAQMIETPNFWPDEVPAPSSGMFNKDLVNDGLLVLEGLKEDYEEFKNVLAGHGYSKMSDDDKEKSYPKDAYGEIEVYEGDKFDIVLWEFEEGYGGEMNIVDKSTGKPIGQN